MLQVFGFERIGVLVGDLYFVNPRPEPGQEGPEQGVRLELRVLDRGELPGSIYSAQAVGIGRPLWRVDLLESVDRPGSLDRAHHHPRFDGWEPGPRCFGAELSADPRGWLADRLAALAAVLHAAGARPDDAGPGDTAGVAGAAPDILRSVDRLLVMARTADRSAVPPPAAGTAVRTGWL